MIIETRLGIREDNVRQVPAATFRKGKNQNNHDQRSEGEDVSQYVHVTSLYDGCRECDAKHVSGDQARPFGIASRLRRCARTDRHS